MAIVPVLYDEHGNPGYFSIEQAAQLLTAAYKFDRHRRAFETAPLGDSKKYCARELLRNIETIKSIIPKEVREIIVRFPEDYELSDSELGG